VFNEVIALLSVFSAFFALLLAFRIYRKAPPWIDEKIEGVMGIFLEPDKEGKNLVDRLADRFGTGFRMSLLAQKSGEARHGKAIQKRVFDAIKEKIPEVRLGIKAAEQFGLGDLVEDPEDAMALMGVLKRFGIDPMAFLKGNSPGSESGHGQGVM